MDQKENKRYLKDAKEALKNKDFKTALRLCKAVLKDDRSNYVALVLFGASLQETEHRDQAPNAYRKACEVSPDQPLAWQGLISFYEKNLTDSSNESNSVDLLNAYQHLLPLENDQGKKEMLAQKVAALSLKLQKPEVCCQVLSNMPHDPEAACMLRRVMVITLCQFKDLAKEHSLLMEKNLPDVITEWKVSHKRDDSGMQECYRRYLKYLYRVGKTKELLQEAVVMTEKFPQDPYPFEWVGKLWLEFVTEGKDVAFIKNSISKIIACLKSLLPTSSIIPSAVAAFHFIQNEFILAREELHKAISSKQASHHVHLLLIQVELRLHCFNEALDLIKELKEKLQLVSKDKKEHLLLFVENFEVQALSQMQDEDKLKAAVALSEKLLLKSRDDRAVHIAAARALVSLNLFEDAQSHLVEIGLSSKVSLLEAQMLLKSGNVEKASYIVESLAADSRDAEIWLEVANLRDLAGKQVEKLTALMEAARCDPHNWIIFIRLGDHYRNLKTTHALDKARRCYQKALQINPKSDEAGEKLSDVLHLLNDVISNKKLLEVMTKSKVAKWAWLRLGLLHTEGGDIDQAILSLCNAVRCDPSDSRIWESLGDAYMEREAWYAALKSYQKVSLLNPDSIYCAYQVGVVKLRMGAYEEALISFRELVSKSPDYVPALQGKGEAAFRWAEALEKEQRLGFARDRCQEAIDALCRALTHRRDLSCTWKLLADVCLLAARLPSSYCAFHVADWLVSPRDGPAVTETQTSLLNKMEMFLLAERLYCRAMPASLDNSLLWHDAAAAHFWHASAVIDEKLRAETLQRGLLAAQRAVTINPNNGSHWNLLGVIAAAEGVKQRALAQHAFIQALRLDSGDALAWMNLGVLYLVLGEIKLSNKSFSAAQRADHDLTNSWVGQAMVAESLAHHDTMDLFRHAASLEYHGEGCVGYAHWVLTNLLECEVAGKKKSENLILKDMERMNALAVAADCMQWYTEKNPNDYCGWNMLGLILERQSLYKSSQRGLNRALEEAVLEKCQSNFLDIISCNLGRVFTNLQQFEEAILMFQKVKKSSFASQSGLALALYKAQKFEEAYEAYSCTLEWLAPDDETKAHILLAMAAMQYSFNQLEDCKTLLFQSIQPKPLSAHPLLALCALGLLHNDLNMSKIMLKELSAFKDDPKFLSHIGLLQAFTSFLQGDQKGALCALGKSVHRHPTEGALWLSLAQVQMHAYPQCDVRATGRTAHAALLLGRSNMDISKVQSLACVAELLSGTRSSAVFSSQKAVHQFPIVAENWSTLVATILHEKSDQQHAAWLRDVVSHVRRKLQPSSAGLRKWLGNYEHHLTSISTD